jgi:hypothetical protein
LRSFIVFELKRWDAEHITQAVWKRDFVRSVQKAAANLGGISEEEILKTVREYRSGRKKLPEITVVARTKKENGLEESLIRPSW